MATERLEAGMLIEGYELSRPLGHGGMGDVWLASEVRAGRQVALKFIMGRYLEDADALKRFFKEARSLGSLEHDRIVALYNVVEKEPGPALVLRYIDGCSLENRISKEGPQPPEFVLGCARDILSALGFAHERGIIHRDIKPANVLVDRQNRCFLSDFGIAVAASGTQTGSAIGTLSYMSPEQLMRPWSVCVEEGGQRSDIFSFGVLLYETLTARLPFANEKAMCMDPPPALRDVNATVAVALEAVVLRCLEKDPAHRPQSCAELLEDLEAAIGGTAVSANAARAAGYSATVVEPRKTVQIPPSGSQPLPRTPAPQPVGVAPPSARPRLGQRAWLGVGALAIAAGIGYVALTPSKTGSVPPRNQTDSTVQPPSSMLDTKGSGPDDSTSAHGRPKRTQTDDPTKQPKPDDKLKTAEAAASQADTLLTQGSFCEAQAPIGQALSLYPQRADFLQLRSQAEPACNAKKDLALEKPCEGQTEIEKAIGVNPRLSYTQLRSQAKQACDVKTAAVQGTKAGEQEKLKADADFTEAQELYKQGEYCPAKVKMDEAIKLKPGNASFVAFRDSTVRGCNANGK